MNGCFNRQPYLGTVHTAHGDKFPFRMSPLCEYSVSELGKTDPECKGCKWIEITQTEKAKGKA